MFTIAPRCAIILYMNRVAAAIAGAALLLAVPAGLKTEYAEAAGGTSYPDFVSTLDIGAIECYSCSDGQFALIGDNSARELYIYSDGALTEEDGGAVIEGGTLLASDEGLYAYRHGTDITQLWHEGGDLLFADATGQSYTYSDGTVAESSAKFTPDNTVDFGNFTAFISADGKLNIIDTTVSGESKVYEDGAYSQVTAAFDGALAIRDGLLCLISGDTLEELEVLPLEFRFIDKSHETQIAVGDSAALLRHVSAEAQFVTVAARKYVTEIDLGDIGGEYFAVGEGGTFMTSGSMSALLLCTSGDADIIVTADDKTYITDTIGVTSAAAVSDAPFGHGQLNYSAGIYSSPYMCGATELTVLEPGAKLEVLYELTVQNNAALTADFWRVSYTDESGTVTEGYVASGFITAYDFSGEDGQFGEPQTPEDYSEENAVLTVVLVLVIVVLVIAGVAYLAHTGSAGKRKKERERTAEDREDDEEE